MVSDRQTSVSETEVLNTVIFHGKPETDSLDVQKAVSSGIEGILAPPSLISRIIAGYDIVSGCDW